MTIFIAQFLSGFKPLPRVRMDVVGHFAQSLFSLLDLVEWQLRVASGEKLPRQQDEISINGHAFEARLYAEDATKGFLPAIGTLHHLQFPEGSGLRVETGVRQGDTISPFYDPMIAKLVTHGKTREAALDALIDALSRTQIAGSVVNTRFLAALAADPDFAAGNVDTGMIERSQEALTAPAIPAANHVAAAALAAAQVAVDIKAADPWSSLAGYAHFQPLAKQVALTHDGEEIVARLTVAANGNVQVETQGQTAMLKLASGQPATARWPGPV